MPWCCRRRAFEEQLLLNEISKITEELAAITDTIQERRDCIISLETRLRKLTTSFPVMGDVDAKELRWKYNTTQSLHVSIKTQCVLLVRGDWLANYAGPLPRRQDLPTEAVWDPDQLSYLKHALVERSTGDEVAVIVVSYCWQTPSHPDPDGELSHVLKPVLAAFHRDVSKTAVFLDWCSLFQEPRTEDEERKFWRGMRHTTLWFSSSRTWVWRLTKFAEGSRSYASRGWPTFESAVAHLNHASGTVVDIAAGTVESASWDAIAALGKVQLHAPMLPQAFTELMLSRGDGGNHQIGFSHQDDRTFIYTQYHETFKNIMGSHEILHFGNLDWDDTACEVLARCLLHCTRLWWLRLGNNRIGDVGVMALADVLVLCNRLQELDLSNNVISDVGVVALAGELQDCPSLDTLDLSGNLIGDSGASALSAACLASDISLSVASNTLT